MKNSRPLAAIIPAAGLSSRMGCFKPLLPLNQGTVIGATIAGFKHIADLDIIVVVGHRKAELIAALRHEPVQIVENPCYREGMFSSIAAGASGLAPSHRAFFVMPADIALVRPATLVQLAAAAHLHPGQTIHPVFDGRRGHPPLIPADLAPALREWRQDGGLKAFLAAHGRTAVDLPVADRHIHQDLDSPDDYLRAAADSKRRDIPNPAECEQILTVIHPVSDTIRRHGRQVARVAVSIAQALMTAGSELDLDAIQAAAWLHDLAKGRKDHALVGELLIRAMGFARIAEIVGAHTDLPYDSSSPITETEVVHLADKLVKDDRLIALAAKFQHPLQRWAADPEALKHVLRRRATAFRLKAKIEAVSGQSLEEIVAPCQ